MISVQGVSMRFGSKVLFDDVTTTFSAGRRYGLTGPNGAGKSTFMKLLTGELPPQKGTITAPAPRRGAAKQGHPPPVERPRGARAAVREAGHDRRGRHAARRARRHRWRRGR